MRNTQNCVCRHKYRHLLISMFFLLLSSLTHHSITMVQGRPISKLFEVEAEQKNGKFVEVEEEKMTVRARQIGSRPPRCDRRCKDCDRCEAVQIPVAPIMRYFSINSININYVNSNNNNFIGTKYVYSSNLDGFSNYKPMSWKCKCGNFIFNP